jgi:hypothetical protein
MSGRDQRRRGNYAPHLRCKCQQRADTKLRHATNSTKMDAIELLKRDARERRNTAILAAKRRYFVEIAEINALDRKLRITKAGRPRRKDLDRPIVNGNLSCFGMTLVATLETILGEGKQMTSTELTIEVQRRGCRAKDDPRALAKTVRSCLANAIRKPAGRFS